MTSYRTVSDQQLLADCRFEAFRGPGPGGQKRNKTSSAVRLTHAGSGLSVIAGESRSQHRNKKMALSRLRHKIALTIREKVIPADLPDPGILAVSSHSQAYPGAMGKAMDILSANSWSISDAGKMLGVSTGRLISFLRTDPAVWMEVNRRRQLAGLRGLNS